MLVIRIIVAVLALLEVTAVLLSVLRSVVLPRAVPARLARLTFLIVRIGLLALRGRTDYATRDRVLALQAPLGLFAQLLGWALLSYVGFAALFWAVGDTAGGPLARTLELSGSSMLTLPQLVFFRSPHPQNHWVLSAETVLDGAALLMTVCDVPRQSRAELCIEAGVGALVAVADFLGVPHRPPEDDAEITLPADLFDDALRRLEDEGVPVRDDREAAWREFRQIRADTSR